MPTYFDNIVILLEIKCNYRRQPTAIHYRCNLLGLLCERLSEWHFFFFAIRNREFQFGGEFVHNFCYFDLLPCGGVCLSIRNDDHGFVNQDRRLR